MDIVLDRGSLGIYKERRESEALFNWEDESIRAVQLLSEEGFAKWASNLLRTIRGPAETDWRQQRFTGAGTVEAWRTQRMSSTSSDLNDNIVQRQNRTLWRMSDGDLWGVQHRSLPRQLKLLIWFVSCCLVGNQPFVMSQGGTDGAG